MAYHMGKTVVQFPLRKLFPPRMPEHPPEHPLYPRFAAARLAEALQDSPVVLLHGPRQCGKTTLARTLCGAGPLPEALRGFPEYEYVNLEDRDTLAYARNDPVGFVDELPERAVLDEVQLAPWLFSDLKLEVDRNRTPGRFLLTGSMHVLFAPKLSNSLTGRLQIVPLHPLAQCERERHAPDFLERLFGDSFGDCRGERLGAELAERAADGGYPAALALPAGRRRARWHRNHIEVLAQRDVRELSQIRMVTEIPHLLEIASAQTAQVLNTSAIASDFGLNRGTVEHYLALLERVFALDRLPGWHRQRRARPVRAPKLHVGDTGLACALLGADAASLAKDRTLFGHLLETLVFQELRRQASWSGEKFAFFHYRDTQQAEVDIVIERGIDAVAGVEVKAGATVTEEDFKGIKKLARATGDRFAAGVVLYDGRMRVGFGDRFCAVPLRRLWETS